jgi:hypothetical protein
VKRLERDLAEARALIALLAAVDQAATT